MLGRKDQLAGHSVSIQRKVNFAPCLGTFPNDLEKGLSVPTDIESPISNLYSRVLVEYRENNGLNALVAASQELRERLFHQDSAIQGVTNEKAETLARVKAQIRESKRESDLKINLFVSLEGSPRRRVYDLLSGIGLSVVAEIILPIQTSIQEHNKSRQAQSQVKADFERKAREYLEVKIQLQEELARIKRQVDQEFSEWLLNSSDRVLAYAISQFPSDALQKREQLFRTFATRQGLDTEVSFAELAENYAKYTQEIATEVTANKESELPKKDLDISEVIQETLGVKEIHKPGFYKDSEKTQGDKEKQPGYPLGLLKIALGGYSFDLFESEEGINDFVLKNSKSNNAVKQDLTRMIEYLRRDPLGVATKPIVGRNKRKQPNIILGSRVLVLRSLNPNKIPDYVPVHKDSDQRRITYVVDPNGGSPKVYIRRIYLTHDEYDKKVTGK